MKMRRFYFFISWRQSLLCIISSEERDSQWLRSLQCNTDIWESRRLKQEAQWAEMLLNYNNWNESYTVSVVITLKDKKEGLHHAMITFCTTVFPDAATGGTEELMKTYSEIICWGRSFTWAWKVDTVYRCSWQGWTNVSKTENSLSCGFQKFSQLLKNQEKKKSVSDALEVNAIIIFSVGRHFLGLKQVRFFSIWDGMWGKRVFLQKHNTISPRFGN